MKLDDILGERRRVRSRVLGHALGDLLVGVELRDTGLHGDDSVQNQEKVREDVSVK